MRALKSRQATTLRPLAARLAASLVSLTVQVLGVAPASAAPGDITTFAGTGSSNRSGDGGPAVAAGIGLPSGLAVDASGDVFITDQNTPVVRKVSPAGTITTVAGTGQSGSGGDGGPATQATFGCPVSVALDPVGNLFINDQCNYRIREVDHATGTISTFAGDGDSSGTGEGIPATSASVAPEDMVVTSAGLFEADFVAKTIRKIDHAGTITTFATGFSEPVGLTASADGTFYATDFVGNTVSRIDSSGKVTTIAGSGAAGYSGDGGPATAAELHGPYGIAVAAGTVFVSEYFNDVVRKIDRAGTITTIAGTGNPGFAGDGGPATAAELSTPNDLALEANGDLLVADYGNSRVRRIESALPPDLLQLTGTASPVPATLNQPLTYAFAVSNPGTVGPATGVVLKDHLPAGATFTGASASTGMCLRSGSTVVCQLGTLAPFATATVAIQVTPTSPNLLTDSATVSATESDPAPADNRVTLLDGTAPAALAVGLQGSSGLIPPAAFTERATVTNGGPAPASTVKLTALIPTGLVLGNFTPSQGSCTITGAHLACSLGGLGVGQAATVTMKLTPIKATTFAVPFKVSADQFIPGGAANTLAVTVGCGAKVTSSIALTADMGPCVNSHGLIVAADNVTLDLNGHTVRGASVGAGYSNDQGNFAGVVVRERIGVTVRGGTVSGFDGGVEILGGGRNTITGMTLRNNIGRDGTARDPEHGFDEAILGDGILVGQSKLNLVTSNTLVHNGPFDGIGVLGLDSDSNAVRANTVQNTVARSDGTGGVGIMVSPQLFQNESRTPPISHDNVVSNTVTANSASGISVQSDDNAVISNNTVTNNGRRATPGNGIDVSAIPGFGPAVTQDQIVGNTIAGSGADGIQINSDGNVIKQNSATRNNWLNGQWFDLQDTNPSCAGNRWSMNTYGPAVFSPSCAGT